jgi:hypothetical protein
MTGGGTEYSLTLLSMRNGKTHRPLVVELVYLLEADTSSEVFGMKLLLIESHRRYMYVHHALHGQP